VSEEEEGEDECKSTKSNN